MKKDVETETWLTVADVARRLGLVPATIRHIASRGKLPVVRTVGGIRLFRLSHVLELERQRAAAKG
jgi:excisionase family DNA binding protein